MHKHPKLKLKRMYIYARTVLVAHVNPDNELHAYYSLLCVNLVYYVIPCRC